MNFQRVAVNNSGLPARALSQEGQRSDRDKYDLDFGFGRGSLRRRPRIARPHRHRLARAECRRVHANYLDARNA